MSKGIKPAQVTLAELRNGAVLNELAAAFHEATKAVRDQGKKATVSLTVEIRPPETKGLAEAPITMVARVKTSLPEAEVPSTLFYIDEEGNATRTPQRQPDLPGVTVIGGQKAEGAA